MFLSGDEFASDEITSGFVDEYDELTQEEEERMLMDEAYEWRMQRALFGELHDFRGDE